MIMLINSVIFIFGVITNYHANSSILTTIDDRPVIVPPRPSVINTGVDDVWLLESFLVVVLGCLLSSIKGFPKSNLEFHEMRYELHADFGLFLKIRPPKNEKKIFHLHLNYHLNDSDSEQIQGKRTTAVCCTFSVVFLSDRDASAQDYSRNAVSWLSKSLASQLPSSTRRRQNDWASLKTSCTIPWEAAVNSSKSNQCGFHSKSRTDCNLFIFICPKAFSSFLISPHTLYISYLKNYRIQQMALM